MCKSIPVMLFFSFHRRWKHLFYPHFTENGHYEKFSCLVVWFVFFHKTEEKVSPLFSLFISQFFVQIGGILLHLAGNIATIGLNAPSLYHFYFLKEDQYYATGYY
ncbi:MAG TPA: hypothetical protein DCP22_07170, partial [Ruminococcaceae bacterium]|nr:hypothetical protein [Oscillospiraceae bacterium]